MTRRLTTSSARAPRLRRLSCTALVSSAGEMRRIPRRVRAAPRADLGDDRQIVRIRMKRLADDLVDDMRPVEVAGVDVVDAARDGLAQHGDRRVAILRRPEHAGPGELHRAVAHALHGAVAQGESAAAVMSVMAGSPVVDRGSNMAPSRRRAIIPHNRHRLYGMPNNGDGPGRPHRLRGRGCAPAAFAMARGGAASPPPASAKRCGGWKRGSASGCSTAPRAASRRPKPARACSNG